MYLSEPQPTAYDLRFRLIGTDVRVHPLFWLMVDSAEATSVIREQLGLDDDRWPAALVRAFSRPPGPLGHAVRYLLWINLFWGLLNLLPVWPLDGGQISGEVASALSPRHG